MNLYLVIREPTASRHDLRAVYWFTRAESKAAAVRRFRELCPRYAGPDRTYCAPRAELVTTDGPPSFV